jgi:hypothetical protein
MTQVLHRKAVLGGLGVEDGNGFPARLIVEVDMGDFPALELLHAAAPLTNEPDLGGVLTPPGDRGGEDIRKHPPIRGVRAAIAHREQGDLVVRGPLRQGIGEWRVERMHHRRPGGPLGFQALIALEAAGDVVDGFALFPHQFYPVDAAITLVQEGQIIDVSIGNRCLKRPLEPLAGDEHGEKLFARRRHRRHAHQPAEHSGHEHAPPRLLPAHTLLLHTGWLSSRSHPRRAGAADLPSAQTR